VREICGRVRVRATLETLTDIYPAMCVTGNGRRPGMSRPAPGL
jgi:hypothetical protein